MAALECSRHVVDEFAFFDVAFGRGLIDIGANGGEDSLIKISRTDLERSALTRNLRVVLPKFF